MRKFFAGIFYTACVSCYVVYVAVLIGTNQAVVFCRVLGKKDELNIRVSSGMSDEIQPKANRGTEIQVSSTRRETTESQL